MKKCKHDGLVRTDGLTFVDCLKCGRYMTLEEWEKDNKKVGKND